MSEIRQFEQLGRADIEVAGGKGANLGELTRAGFDVPPGFVITTSAYRGFVEANGLADRILELAQQATAPDPADDSDADGVADQIHSLFVGGTIPEPLRLEILDAYARLGDAYAALGDASPRPGDGSLAVAVRSSATAEDLAEASFAGQQDTFLNVRGNDGLLVAVRRCWASLWTARALAYRARQGIDPSVVALAVVVQRLVDADAAGVMFTANPANGRRDQVVISAAWGLGESIVSGSVNTDDLVVSHDGLVVSRHLADKSVMTVSLAEGTEEREVPAALRGQSVLDDAAAAELAALGVRIAEHFGAPQDIEWVQASGQFFVVQSRPITALPEPATAPPTQWQVPDPKGFYFRASIVEQLPDPLSPLFADLVAPAVTRSLLKLMREFLGEVALSDDDLRFPTINGYAYYQYSRGALTRMMVRTPSAIHALLSGSFGGVARWQEQSHPRYVEVVQRRQLRPVGDLSSAELLTGVVELLDAGTEYYTSVQSIIPLAAMSEVTFSGFYNRLIRRPGDPGAEVFLLGFDSEPIRAEKSLFDLATWTATHPELAEAVSEAPAARAVEQWRTAEPPENVAGSLWQEWSSRFQTHLDTFGHAVYNLDFVNAVPADDPAPLISTLKFYLRGEGLDPYERQRRSAERRDGEATAVLGRLDSVRGRAFSRLLHWAQSTAPVREDALADVGLAWPLLRRMLAELGRRVVVAGAIKDPDDVFWLHEDELVTWLSPEQAGADSVLLGEAIQQRKADWRGQRQVTPPQLLPRGTWLDSMESLMPASAANETGAVLTGIGASAGQVTASARVLSGPEDFSRMRAGDILVTSITTPAWTSLFAMAAGVVTDIGGPLSHSSIVAREYGIPAVLGTGVATRRIRDGQRILLDGDAGTVTLLDVAAADDDAPESVAETPDSRPGLLEHLRHPSARLRAVGIGAGAAFGVVWLLRRARAR